MTPISNFVRAASLGLALAAGLSAAVASSYPERAVTLVVPFAAGGMTDVLARQLSRRMQDELRQPAVVDNRVGAGGIIGAERVAKSRPDGHTLLITTTAHVVNPAITKQLPYDTEKDFVPVAMLARTPNVLVVHPSVPAKNLQELIAFARKSGGVSYGSSGSGGTTHLSGELLAARTGAPFLHVPYKGTALAVNDVLGGQIQAAFVDALTAVKYVESQKLRAIGVSTAQRNPSLSEVPTIAEQGVPGYETEIWIGLYAPRGTPPEIVRQLNRIAVGAMNEPAFKDMLARQGTAPGTMDTVAFEAYVKREIAKWHAIVRDARIEPQ
ncbi:MULTISPECIES: tripartite tricarboxylate transporter substrate binding protein [unclassified Variovorax]|uniref:tripartite tricarboxylate transporter substrate binding protein n=1 Tax=unclassified Variovorax TaxID=663243 RepID=UPI0008BEEB4A|nr:MULTISPECIES: tripartite tricarboxylate transporter substrate binding protein [unclassified Variovorax]SEK10487.1 Tripartite-type tricarboxylate transporter, receptor component TctC [Variovorax sp. OK202]SFD68511.1 Tripartite-type tricarboxylate transporter, receptor component TctC [Variovorax sp. OK212]